MERGHVWLLTTAHVIVGGLGHSVPSIAVGVFMQMTQLCAVGTVLV